MNDINKKPSDRAGEPANRQDTSQPRVGPASDDAGKLATAIEQNRANINRGWEMITKLDQLLSSLDARLEVNAKKLRSSTTPARESAEERPVLTNAA